MSAIHSRTSSKLVLDPRVAVTAESMGLVPAGASNYVEQEILADGTNFSSQILFTNIVSPNLATTVVSRCIRLRYRVTVTWDSTNAAAPRFPTTTYSATSAIDTVFRQLPLQSCTNTLQITLNGATVTINPRFVLTALARRFTRDQIELDLCEAPCAPDIATVLRADAVATAAAAVGVASAIPLTSCSPLSKLENSQYQSRVHIPVAYDVSTPAAAVATWEITEPLYISPLSLQQLELSLANVNSMSVQLNYASLTDMLVSSKAYAGVATIAIADPRLCLQYQQVPSFVNIPRVVSYPYSNVIYFTKTFKQAGLGTDIFNAGGASNPQTVNLQSDNLRLSSLPEMIYIFARPVISGRSGGKKADACLALGNPQDGKANFSIQFGNKSGLLATAAISSIFKMSRLNGIQTSWERFTHGDGAVIALRPAWDLSIDAATDSLQDAQGYYNMQYAVQMNNFNWVYGGASGYGLEDEIELVTVVVQAGVFSITPEAAFFSLSSMSEAEQKALVATGDYVTSEQVQPQIRGSGLFSNIKNVFQKGKQAYEMLKPVADSPLGQQIASAVGKRLGM